LLFGVHASKTSGFAIRGKALFSLCRISTSPHFTVCKRKQPENVAAQKGMKQMCTGHQFILKKIAKMKEL
jgi:hypothetical protein